MAGFVQLVEFETDDPGALEAALIQFQADHPGVMTSTASTLTEDRDRPGTFISIVEFPSYDKAMEQSNHPALTSMAQELAHRMKATPRFRNLDVRSSNRSG